MYFIRLCLLLFYLKTLIHCEIITLKYNNSVVCVATESDVNSTIYLKPQIGNATLNKTLKDEFEWTNDDWDNKILNSGIVTDERWQEFKIVENVTYNKSGTYGLSMCGKGNLTLDNPRRIQDSTNRMCDEWKHYKVEIEKTNTTYNITVFNEANTSVVTKTFGANETIKIKSTQGPSFWKMHKIKCKRSATPSAVSSSIDVFWSGKVHLSMFVYVNVNSSLSITLKSDDKKVNQTIHGELNSAKWQKVELTIESVNKTTLYIDRELTSKDKEKPLWAIDAINFRSHKPAIYQAHLTEHYGSTFPICKPLNSANHLPSTYGKTEEFTQNEKNRYCHFVHEKDLSQCQPNKNTNGIYYDCDTCHKLRRNDCSDKFPVLVPTLEKISNKSVTIRVNNFRYDSYEREPKYYQVQFKQENEQQFKTFKTIPYSKRNETLEIPQLSTRDWSYRIRILPTVDSKSCEVKVRELEVFKRSLTTTNVTPTSISLSWSDNMKSKSSEWIIDFRCQQLNCTTPQLVDFINVKKLTQNISSLEPLTTCDFKLYTKNRLLIDMISVTTPPKSLDDGEFPNVSFPNNFHIKIKFPEFNGPLTYNVSYLCVNQWCKKDSVGSFSTVRENCERKEFTSITNVTLKPFSDYNVTVTVSRSTEKRLKTYQLKTPSGKPRKVQKLSIYCRDRETFWIRWKPPYPPTGEILNYTILQENKSLTQWDYTSCTWNDFTCAKLYAQSVSSNITVQAQNKDYEEWGNPKSLSLSLNDFQRPQNLTLEIHSSNEVTVTWEHPFVKNFYLNISSKGTRNNYPVMPDSCQHKYGKSIIVDYDIVYKISVWPESSQTENATITALFKASPYELSSKPFLKLCFDEFDINCTFLIPKPEQSTETSFRIEVDKNGARWNITYLHFDNDYLSVANYSLNLHCFQGGVKQTLPVYLVNGNTSYLICQTTNQAATTAKAAFICFLIVAVVTFLFVGYLIFAYIFKKYPFEIRRTRSQNKHEFHPPETIDTIRRYQEKNVRTIRKKCDLPLNSTELEVLIESEKPRQSVKLIDSVPILVKDFENYLIASLEDNSFYHNALTDQYKKLQTKKNKKSCTAGSLQKNNHKNRYKNILAYDDTRVILNNNDNEDYINANYIEGYEAPKAFIATQAPSESTFADFWWMIWQENVKNIIMLTELIEKGQAKSEKYWPEPQIKRRFGKILIENVVEKIFSDYIHRQFNIKCENEVRQVHHFQYTTWPDHGVPLYPQNFTPFMKRLLAAPQQNSPIVVHCNAGCGRTGTLILCDIVLRMAAREKKVDFVKVLLKMRTQRCNLVNNVKQYIFAHFVVLECLFRADFSIPVNDAFQDEVFKVLRKISVKPLMEELDKVTEQFYRQNKKPRQLTDANKKKNRFPTILPGHSQVYLPTSSETPSNYINAICVDCYRCPKKFIVTQQPLPDTVQDFWRLIKGYEINTIVSLNDIEENDPNCPEFWSVHDDSTKLHVLDVIDDRVYKITKLKIVDMVNRSNEKTVNVLKMKNWKRDTPKPVNIKDLIVVWKEMFNSSWKGDSQIVITCYDGATASGLFVALAHLLEKINYEQICDVFSAARTVRQGREEFVQDWAQIEFLYKAAKVYVEEFDNYDNFNE